jgi:O-antigen/teichoic acid export membrane protein
LRREFVINIVLLLVINVVVKPLYIFGVEARIHNLVGKDAYGLYFALFDLIFLLNVINDPGIQSHATRTIASNPSSFSEYSGKVIGLKLVLGAIFMGFGVLSALFLGYEFKNLSLILLIAAAMFFGSIFLLYRTMMSSVGMYRSSSVLSAFDKLVLLISLGYFAWFYHFENGFPILWLPAGQLFAGVVAVLVAHLLLVKNGFNFRIRLYLKEGLSLLKSSLPYAVFMFLMAAYYRIDGVMLERMHPDGALQAGAYAAAFRFLDVINMLGYLFGGLLFPMYARLLSEKKDIVPLLKTALVLLSILAVITALPLVFYSELVYDLLYFSEFGPYHSVLSTLILGGIPLIISHAFGSIFLSSKRLKAASIVFFIALIFNFTGNFLVIPIHGAQGAAVISALTQFAVLVSLIWLGQKLSIFKLSVSFWLQIFIFIASSFAFTYILNLFFPEWYLSLGLYLIIVLIFGFFLSLQHKDKIRTLIENK